MKQIVAIVGLCGSGKSVVADEFTKADYKFIRFGQITLDKLKEQGIEPNEANQKAMREGLRQEHGMAAFAILNQDKINNTDKNVIIDGLYSWSEYKVLREKYRDNFHIITVYAPPKTRWERLSQRFPDETDTNLRNHHFTQEEAKARDYAEIENIEKGGPIAMADFTIHNTGTIEEAKEKAKEIIAILDKPYTHDQS
ncbi:MAG: AAA family ATPase [archaeon]